MTQGALALLALKASEPVRGQNAVAHSELASGVTQWLLDFSSKARTVKVRPLFTQQKCHHYSTQGRSDAVIISSCTTCLNSLTEEHTIRQLLS